MFTDWRDLRTLRVSARGLAALFLAAMVLVAAGCGSGGSSRGDQKRQEPAQLIDALADSAARLSAFTHLEGSDDSEDRLRQRIDGLMDMMTSAARTQVAEQWVAYLQRTSNANGMRAIEQLSAERQRELSSAQTSAFFTALVEHEDAAPFFARFFSVGYVAHVEQDNAVLVLINSQTGNQGYLGMQRDDDGNLLLMSEAETAEAARQLSRALQAHVVELQRQAIADDAEMRARAAREDEEHRQAVLEREAREQQEQQQD